MKPTIVFSLAPVKNESKDSEADLCGLLHKHGE